MLRKSLFLFFFLSHLGWAHEEANQTIKDNRNKSFAAVGAQDVLKAHCQRQAPHTTEMISWLANKFSRQPRLNQNIQGVSYLNQPQELLEIWDEMIGYKVKEPDPPYAPKPIKITGCQDVFCAATQVFSKEVAVRLLYIRSRFGLQLSPYATQSQVVKNWTLQELDTLILALQDVPQYHFPLRGTSRYFFRRSDDGGTKEASLGLGVFDLWSIQGTPESRRVTMLHEIAHALAEGAFDTSNDWIEMGAWKQVPGKGEFWKTSRPEICISRYAEVNPAEDFAESFTAYRYAPAKLKALAPEKYAYLKWYVFGGIEYVDSSYCFVGENLVRKLNEEYVRSVENSSEALHFHPQVNLCADKWKSLLKNLDKASQVSLSLLSSCISQELSKEQFQAWLTNKLSNEIELEAEVFSMTRAMAPEGLMGAQSKKTKEDLKLFIRDVYLRMMSRYFSDNFMEFKKPNTVCILDPFVSSSLSSSEIKYSDALGSIGVQLRSDLSKMAQRTCEKIKEKVKKLPPNPEELKVFLNEQLGIP